MSRERSSDSEDLSPVQNGRGRSESVRQSRDGLSLREMAKLTNTHYPTGRQHLTEVWYISDPELSVEPTLVGALLEPRQRLEKWRPRDSQTTASLGWWIRRPKDDP